MNGFSGSIAIIISFLIYSFESTAQLAPFGPESASLVNTIESPVNIRAGIVDVKIPLINIAAKDIPISLNLQYHATGIKASDEASWVGLGWRLEGIGSIVQVVKMSNDIDFYGYSNATWISCPTDPGPPVPGNRREEGVTFSHLGCESGIGPYEYSYGQTDDTKNCWLGREDLPLHCATISDYRDCWGNYTERFAQVKDLFYGDKEPDAFYYDFLGYSGVFYFDMKGNINKVYKDNLDIRFTPCEKKFTITTDNGLKVYFEEREGLGYTKIDTFSPWDDNRCGGGCRPANSSAGNTWYITKIESVKTGEKVEFKYNSPTANPVYSIRYSEDTKYHGGSSSVIYDNTNSLDNTKVSQLCAQIDVNERFINVHKYAVQRNPKYISSIEFASGKIEFELDAREDLINAKKIKAIKLYNVVDGQQNLLKKYDFKYEYFQSIDAQNPSTSYYSTSIEQTVINIVQNKRLKLLSVGTSYSPETNSNDNRNPNPYIFGYNEPSGIALPYKTTFDIDKYGFYNWWTSRGSGHNSHLIDDITYHNVKSVHKEASLIGMLNSVINPLGGKTTYQFETFSTSASIPLGISRIKSISQYFPESNSTYVKNYEYVNDKSIEVVKARKGNFVAVNLNCNFDNSRCDASIRCEIVTSTETGNLSLQGNISLNTWCDKVIEHLGSNDENGKIEYIFDPFTKNNIYPLDKASNCTFSSCDLPLNYPLFVRPNVIQLRSKISYKKTGSGFQAVSKEEYDYELEESQTTSVGIIPVEENTSGNNTARFFSYRIPTFWTRLKEARNYIYDQTTASKSSYKTTQIGYNSSNLQPNKIVESTSDPNRKRVKQIYYVLDYIAGNTTIASLKTKNFVSLPVEVLELEQITTGGSTTTNVLGGTCAEYDPSFLGLLSKQYALEYGAPKTCSNFIASNGGTACAVGSTGTYSRNADYVLQLSNFYETGNLVQAVGKAGASSAKQWGYCNSYLTADFQNAYKDQVSYAGFESGLDNGWENDEPFVNMESHTGFWSIKVNKSSTTNFGPACTIKPAIQMGKYKAGAWVKYSGSTTDKVTFHFYTGKKSNPNVSFPNGIGYASINVPNTQNEWKYIELEIDMDAVNALPAVSGMSPKEDLSLRATISNTDASVDVYVDDLIIYPSTSIATTYTYEPLVGVKSVSSQDGNIVNYEYDHLGNPYMQKDLDGRVVSKKETIFKK